MIHELKTEETYFAWRNAFESAQNWMRNEIGWKKNSPGADLEGMFKLKCSK